MCLEALMGKKTMVLIMLVVTIKSTCYNYDNGDIYPDYNTSYCSRIIKWPVSDQTFVNYIDRDSWALGNYTKLKQNYYQQGLVTLDCMGMAKYFMCAMAYPTCNSGQPQITGMCNWMCDLFSVRCGTNNQFYTLACLNTPTYDSDCSFKQQTMVSLLVLTLMLILIY